MEQDFVVKKLLKAIESLADEITGQLEADEALKYTQATLNAANAIMTLRNLPKE